MMDSFLEYHHIPYYECIHCRACKIQVAVVQDYTLMVPALVPVGIFNKVLNVEVSDDVNDHYQHDGNTLANTNCVECGTLLGWKFIAVTQPSEYIIEGRFFMRLHKISFWNDTPLLRLKDEQDVDANEQNADQDVDANEQNVDQDGSAPMN